TIEPEVRLPVRSNKGLFAGAAAAAVVLALGIAFLPGFNKPRESVNGVVKKSHIPVSASKNTPSSPHLAIIMRADSSLVSFDNLAVGGTVQLDAATKVRKTSDNTLVYEGVAKNAAAVQVNIGRQRKALTFRLADGTSAQLQPGSVCSYALQRIKNESIRQFRVLDGNVFFSVEKNANVPMRVYTNYKMDIQVLGTCFSVETGKGMEPRVKVITGAVKALGPANNIVIRPGKQAILREGKVVEQPLSDAGELFAWLGEPTYFHFVETNIDTAAREIARFYQLSVSNPENVKGIPLTADLDRNRGVDEVLKDVEKLESGAVRIYRDKNQIVISKAN
ncbi:MAG TPA: FecR family protein, partial [Puia sp.]